MKPKRPLRRPTRRRLHWLVMSASVHCAIQGAHAQDAELSDVVVDSVARRKTDAVPVQKTPAAITAISGAKLDEQGVTNLRDIGNIAPGLSQSKTAVSYLNSSIYIRGIGEPDAQGEPSVGVYIDGLYQPKNLGLNQELLDVERVEVFRGPQGQEFGHASNAGALRISTTDPSEKKTLRARVSYGTWNDVRAGLAVSGPLATNVFGGIAITGHTRDGFTKNVTLDRDTNDVRYGALRGKLRFTPTDKLDIVLSASGTRDTSTARGVQNLAFGDKDAHNQLFPAQSFSNYAYSANVDLRIDEHLRIKSITGANGFHQGAMFDNTGDVYGRGSQYAEYSDRAWSQELRLHGDYGRTGFVTGLYVFHENWFTNRRANTAANSVTNPAAILYRPVYTLIDQGTDTLAWFGEARYKITPALTATLGARYNKERHSQSNQLFNLVAGAPFQSGVGNDQAALFGPPQALVWDAQSSRKWNNWTPKVALDYTWAPGILQYLSFSEGTKAAGYDYRAQTAGAAGLLQAQTPFNPEVAKNLETGIKADWLGGALRTNVSAFYTRFADIQLTTTDPVQLISRRFNAGQGSTRGIEFEANILPLDGLQIDLSGDVLRARLDKFNGVAPTVTLIPSSAVNPGGLALFSGPKAGNTLAYSPRFQGRAGATWRQPLPGGSALLVNGSVDYQTESYSDATENPTTRLPSQTYVNGGITWFPALAHWSVTLAGQNLLNRRYALNPGFTTVTPVNGQAIYRTTNYNDPRTVTLTLRYEL